jgi:DNA polymerase-3 subunit gamma/tau
VGQGHVTTTLRNAIATNRLSHAYLFSGPRGVGKTTTARILAKAVNCLHPDKNNPDNTCELCREISEGRSVNVFEIDGASNRGVDEIRNLRESVRYAPAKGSYKVYVIDEVHMLTKEAFNALLKTLEEPPPYVVFIFATTEIHKVPLTILSRCQRFDFRRIAIEEIQATLRHIAERERIDIDDDALMLVAKRGDGSLRDAQSLFDQVVSFCGSKITAGQIIGMFNMVDAEFYFRVTDAIAAKDAKAGFQIVEDIVSRGFDIREFLNGLIEHFRNILVVRSMKSARLVEASEVTRKRYEVAAAGSAEQDLLRLMKLASDAEASIRWSQQPRFKLELTLLQMVKMDSSVEIRDLLDQLGALKKKLNGQTTAELSDAAEEPMPVPVVRGNVRATQPTLRPEQVVPPPPEPAASPAPPAKAPPRASAAPLPPTAAPEPAVRISEEDAHGKWSEFVAQARVQRIAVGTMLGESHLVDVRDNSLRVGCPDEFHADTLQRHRQFIADLAHQIYGAKLKLETILAQAPPERRHAPAPAAAQPGSPAPARTQEPAVPVQGEDLHAHPVVQALIRDFGAQEIL